MIFQNKTAKKLFLTILMKREFFFWIKKKMSGGLNGAALSAYTNFLCDFDTLIKKKNVDWAKHRQHNTFSQYSCSYYRGKIVSDLFTPCGWPKCAKLKMSAEKLALNLQSPFIERLNNLSCPESYIPFTKRQFKIRITYRLKTAIMTSNIAPGTKIIDNFETTGPIIHRSHLDHPTIFELLPFLEKSLITICFLQLP